MHTELNQLNDTLGKNLHHEGPHIYYFKPCLSTVGSMIDDAFAVKEFLRALFILCLCIAGFSLFLLPSAG